MNTIQITPEIRIQQNENSRAKSYDFSSISFGNNPTDHLFICNYQNGAWGDARIEPFDNLTLSPLALGLHYGQTVFEGFKAYRRSDGNLSIFRLDKHAARMNKSLDRMCMPPIPASLFEQAVLKLVELEQAWVPNLPETSLYLRPFVIATEPRIGVKVSEEYLFLIVCLPMGAYYSKNLTVKVETEFVRAAQGGTGEAKCGGNYGAAFYPTQEAMKQGYDQVLWTDAVHHEFIEESGTMNCMFVIDGTIITPALSGSILDGVTRDSLLQLASDLGIPCEERPISYKELEAAFESGRTVEAFGVGTAAVISPIEKIDIQGKSYHPLVGEKSLYYRLKQHLNDIRTGLLPDTHGWNTVINLK